MRFCIPLTHEKAHEILGWAERKGLHDKLGLITEWGAAIPDGAEFVIELADSNDKESKNWFATIDFLERGPDGVFVRLNHPLQKKNGTLPRFEDVFVVRGW
jgi:hypothetical protein